MPKGTFDTQSRPNRYLTEPQKRAVIAAVATGQTQKQVAQQFGIHPRTVQNLVRTVRHADIGGGNNPLALEAKDLRGGITLESYQAVKRSVSDTKQVHAGANTALTWLTKIGEIGTGDQGSTTYNTVVNNIIHNYPPDVAARFVCTHDVIDLGATGVAGEENTPTPRGLLADNGAPADKS